MDIGNRCRWSPSARRCHQFALNKINYISDIKNGYNLSEIWLMRRRFVAVEQSAASGAPRRVDHDANDILAVHKLRTGMFEGSLDPQI
jgi:hypothetical protein